MASDRKSLRASSGSPQRAPEWADGLKQLYDSVVQEDLPDSFRDLLARLDDADPRHDGGQNDAGSQCPGGRGVRV